MGNFYEKQAGLIFAVMATVMGTVMAPSAWSQDEAAASSIAAALNYDIQTVASRMGSCADPTLKYLARLLSQRTRSLETKLAEERDNIRELRHAMKSGSWSGNSLYAMPALKLQDAKAAASPAELRALVRSNIQAASRAHQALNRAAKDQAASVGTQLAEAQVRNNLYASEVYSTRYEYSRPLMILCEQSNQVAQAKAQKAAGETKTAAVEPELIQH